MNVIFFIMKASQNFHKLFILSVLDIVACISGWVLEVVILGIPFNNCLQTQRPELRGSKGPFQSYTSIVDV